MLQAKKTGNKRYRVEQRFLRKPLVVLQIEIEGFVPEFDPQSIQGKIRRWYVDARPEDVMEDSNSG